ncbi:MAG: hypothetical protein MZV70_52360 [Desulfobacterales bacterium]|nr:hypothetical protein [Desulfobacterales bacterium]
MYSLDNAFNELLDKIRDPDAFNPAKSDPVLFLAYPPELMLDHQEASTAMDIKIKEAGFEVRRVSLADILWDTVDKSDRWDIWLELEADAKADQINEAVRDVLRQGNTLVDRVAEVIESTPETPPCCSPRPSCFTPGSVHGPSRADCTTRSRRRR